MKTKFKTVKVLPKKFQIAPPKTKKTSKSYDEDFCLWIQAQTKLLKKRDFDHLDIENLIEEIESLGRSDKRALNSQMIRLLMHLLKLEYQPDGQGNSNSWKSSILSARIEIKLLLKDSPSLKNELKKILPEAYEDAKQKAASETQLDLKTFPKKCPWHLEDILL
jgi:hypothetical protein